MRLVNDSSRYGAVSQALHWITVGLVIVLLTTGKAGDIEADEPGSALFMWHGSLGVLVLLFACARLVWGLVSPAPPLPQGMTRLGRVLARAMHLCLFVLLFALPVSGWLVTSAEGASVNFFGVATLPGWQGAAGAPAARGQPASPSAEGEAEIRGGNDENDNAFKELHEILGNALLILASLHVLAALKHQFVDRDDLLKRMLPHAASSVGGSGAGKHKTA